MANTRKSLVYKEVSSGSKILIFTGKLTGLKPWLAAF